MKSQETTLIWNFPTEATITSISTKQQKPGNWCGIFSSSWDEPSYWKVDNYDNSDDICYVSQCEIHDLERRIDRLNRDNQDMSSHLGQRRDNRVKEWRWQDLSYYDYDDVDDLRDEAKRQMKEMANEVTRLKQEGEQLRLSTEAKESAKATVKSSTPKITSSQSSTAVKSASLKSTRSKSSSTSSFSRHTPLAAVPLCSISETGTDVRQEPKEKVACVETELATTIKAVGLDDLSNTSELAQLRVIYDAIMEMQSTTPTSSVRIVQTRKEEEPLTLEFAIKVAIPVVLISTFFLIGIFLG